MEWIDVCDHRHKKANMRNYEEHHTGASRAITPLQINPGAAKDGQARLDRSEAGHPLPLVRHWLHYTQKGPGGAFCCLVDNAPKRATCAALDRPEHHG